MADASGIVIYTAGSAVYIGIFILCSVIPVYSLPDKSAHLEIATSQNRTTTLFHADADYFSGICMALVCVQLFADRDHIAIKSQIKQIC